MLSRCLHELSEWLRNAATALGSGGRRGLRAWLSYSLHLPVNWLPAMAGIHGFLAREEFRNYHHNILAGTLHFPAMERALAGAQSPLVIDVGVNYGVTVRWWNYLNSAVRVVAIDMMQEALDYTGSRVAAAGDRSWLQTHVAVVGDKSGETIVHYDDPMLGTNRGDADGGAQSRRIRMATLDELTADLGTADVVAVKIDIEGAGGRALLAAPALLGRTHFVIAECHGPDEMAQMTESCLRAGLSLVGTVERMLFFARIPA